MRVSDLVAGVQGQAEVVVGEEELPLEDGVVVGHADKLLVIRVHYGLLEEVPQTLSQNALQSRPHHALGHVVEVLCSGGNALALALEGVAGERDTRYPSLPGTMTEGERRGNPLPTGGDR